MDFLKHLLNYPGEIAWALLSIALVLGAVAWSKTIKVEFKKGHVPGLFEILREIRRSNSRRSYLFAAWFIGGAFAIGVLSAALRLWGSVA